LGAVLLEVQIHFAFELMPVTPDKVVATVAGIHLESSKPGCVHALDVWLSAEHFHALLVSW